MCTVVTIYMYKTTILLSKLVLVHFSNTETKPIFVIRSAARFKFV